MYERFTDRSRKVMVLATQKAKELKHEYVGTEHILLGLLVEENNVASNILKKMNVSLHEVGAAVERIVQRGPDMSLPDKLPLTPRSKKVIEHAITNARELNHNYVGTEHLLLGLLSEPDGIACQVLTEIGVSLDKVKAEIVALLKEKPVIESQEEEEARAKIEQIKDAIANQKPIDAINIIKKIVG